MQKIIIDGLEISACHGVNPEEKTEAQPFVFYVELFTDFMSAAESDNLNDTVNYSSVCKKIQEVTRGNCFNLIEKLATECAYSILESFKSVNMVKLLLKKPRAPMKKKFDSVGVEVCFKREICYLSLGSSLGDRRKYLEDALSALNATRGVTVNKVSHLIETEPYGGVAQNAFINCAAEIETFLTPEELLRQIHRIESEGGRERDRRWDDRTIDIDIVFYGDKIIRTRALTVPHPEYSYRAFVLEPLKEIAPDFICPVKNVKLSQI